MVADGDIRNGLAIAEAILDFFARANVLSVVMADCSIGCPHQEGVYRRRVMALSVQ